MSYVVKEVTLCFVNGLFGDCAREAIELAVKEWRTVRFGFNGIDVVFSPTQLVDSLWKEHKEKAK